MFTLSDKIRVLNTPSEVKVFNNTNTLVTTAAAVALTDRLKIDGYGTFELGNITHIKMRRSRPAVQDSKDWTIVAPAGLAVGDAIEVILSLKTSRYQAEVLVQNAIGKGRTMKFHSAPLTAITPAAIDDAIVAGFNSFLALFPVWTPYVSVTTGATASDGVIRTLGDAPGSISVERVEIKRIATSIPTQTPLSLVSTVNNLAFEGLGLGKFLEESVSMATPGNTDPYGVDTDSTRVNLRGAYTEVIFNYSAPFTENLSTTAADYGATDGIGGPASSGVPANHSFALYLDESTCLGTNGAIHKIAAAAVLIAGSVAGMTVTAQTAPLTAAQERTETLHIANGNSVATSAAFIV